jgi:HEAT repeat protein
LEIARSSDNVELRTAAILAIGRRGGDQVIDTLINLYGSETNAEIKDQIINSLSYSKDPRVTRKLISIARDPQTPIERRRRIVMMLAGRKDPEAVQFLEELVKQ